VNDQVEPPDDQEPEVFEIPLVGDLGENATDVTEKLLSVPCRGECTLFFDCPGGSVYSAMSLMTLICYRNLQATAVVSGECSSAALWPFAACRRRIVTPFSCFLFHPMKWQSEENVQLPEAAEWARHFGRLEDGMNELLSEFLSLPVETLQQWMYPGRYVSGRELVDAGVAEMYVLKP
jgi:ATP-dependent protease ClpP protease subunit